MKADLFGALENLDQCWNAFEDFDGNPMSKDNVRKAIIFGIKQGYQTTAQITREDLENAINGIEPNTTLNKAWSAGWYHRERFHEIEHPDGMDYEEICDHHFNNWLETQKE